MSNSNKTIYIHLGINKTGSTAIESFCVDYYTQLIQKNITYFPKPHFYKNCWPIYFENDREDVAKFLDFQFNAVIDAAKTDNVFLVDEDLTGLNPFFEGFLIRYTPVEGKFNNNVIHRLKKLKSITQNHNSKYIIYLRRQDLFLESLYSQIIKQRHFFSLSFKEFLNVYPVETLQWDNYVENIKEVVGSENLTIKIFESSEFHNNDIVHDCLNECKIDLSDLPQSKQENSRLRADVFENIRAFNNIDLKLKPIYHYRLTPLELCQSVNEKAYGFFQKEERQTFLNQFEESNNKLAQKLKRNQLFDLAKMPSEVINQTSEVKLTDAQIKMYQELYFPKPKDKK